MIILQNTKVLNNYVKLFKNKTRLCRKEWFWIERDVLKHSALIQLKLLPGIVWRSFFLTILYHENTHSKLISTLRVPN